MGFFSRFEGKMDDAIEGFAGTVFKSPIEPAQIAKRAEKMMNRSKLVGAGRQYAPTLYTVLVNKDDDQRLFGFYPTIAAEIETYLIGRAEEGGLVFDCRPLVRFIGQDGLKSGKFDVVAENVAGSIVENLRQEEREYYGLDEANAPEPSLGMPAIQPAVNATPQPTFNAQSNFEAASPYGYAPYQAPIENPGNLNAPNAADPLAYNRDFMPQTMQFPGRNAAVPVAGMPVAGVPGGAIPGIPFANAVAPVAVEGVTQRPPMNPSTPFLVDLQNNRTFPLTAPRVIIGRESSSDLQIDDSNVSRAHAELSFSGNGHWSLRDLGSTNGTKLNGRRISESPLSHGDILTLGITRLEFREH
jgi:hypothetical protein